MSKNQHEIDNVYRQSTPDIIVVILDGVRTVCSSDDAVNAAAQLCDHFNKLTFYN